MPQTRPNKAAVPVNSDAYNLTADLAAMADSLLVTVPVNSQGERDAIPKLVGLTVRRMDLPGLPTQAWDGLAWNSEPVIQIGQGANPPIFKSLEIAVVPNDFLVAAHTFPTPFPNALVSTSLMRNHTTNSSITFNMLNTSDKNTIRFVVNGGSSGTTYYVAYQCWGY